MHPFSIIGVYNRKEVQKFKMAIVYRYFNTDTKEYDYIGIVYSEHRTLAQRVREHSKEPQFQNGNYVIEYFNVATHTDAETWEAHLIAKYETNKRLNKSKAFWGTCSYLLDDKDMWIKFDMEEKKNKDENPTKKNLWANGDKAFFEQYGVYPRDILNFDILNRFCVWTQSNHLIADDITMNLIREGIIKPLNILGDKITLYTDKSYVINEVGHKETEFCFQNIEQTDTSDEEVLELLDKFNQQDFMEISKNGYENGR